MLREIAHFVRTAKEIMPLQKQHPPAEFADILMDRADAQGWADIRRELVGDLTGKVLDLGCGTGTNFQYFNVKATVEAIEPEEDFLAIAVAKANKSPGRVHAAVGDGTKLAFADGSFDAVVLSLVLCSVPSMEQVLAECFRVLRPGGSLRALEHVRSDALVAGVLMDITNPLWMRLNKRGCRWNRNPLAAMKDAGFAIEDVSSFKRFDTVMVAWPVLRVRASKTYGAF
jgi:ubiquinone/menaquinone biosynthesis C-methylase UbiE